jgi:hypothetical protein
MRIRKHLIHAFLIGVTDKEAPRLTPYLAEALASFANCWCVNDWHSFFYVVLDEGVEQRFIGVLEIAHEGVFAKGRPAIRKRHLAACHLILERANVGRQQAMKGKEASLLIGERSTFVEPRVIQQLVSGEASPNFLILVGACRILRLHGLSLRSLAFHLAK